MSREEDVSFNLELNTSRSETNVRKLELVVFRALGVYNRFCRLMGVPEDSPVNQIVAKAQHLTMIIRQLHTASLLLNAAAMTTPVGFAMAGLSVAGVAISGIEFMQEMGE